MEQNNACSFVEKVGKVIYVVNMKPAEDAKQSCDDKFKALITKEAMTLESEKVIES